MLYVSPGLPGFAFLPNIAAVMMLAKIPIKRAIVYSIIRFPFLKEGWRFPCLFQDGKYNDFQGGK
jgi:hypothetical protein